MGEPGETLRDGRYAIVRTYAEGGQATTFEAVDKKTGTLVTIKRFRVRGASSWKEVELAEREARVLASVSHPALPRYVDHFEDAGELFLVTEHIEGESLAAIKRRGDRLSERDTARLLAEASEALDYLHGRVPPIIHRDLKPSNVIRRPDGSFAFIDFGSVRDSLKPEGGSTVVGTFGYMAPEQFQGRALPASDVYAVGATALAMLTGTEPEKLPHRGLAIDVRAALGDRSGRAPMTRLLEKMLEPDPDSRASRIGPLLGMLGGAAAAARDRSPASPQRPARDGRREQQREERRARHDRRDEARAARRERKREKRAARARSRGEQGMRGIPRIIVVVLVIALTLTELALIAALRVVVPIVLTLLSLLFGKTLRDAAARVSTAGEAIHAALARAKDAIAGAPSAAYSEDASAPARADEPVSVGVRPQRVRVTVETAASGPTEVATSGRSDAATSGRSDEDVLAAEEAEVQAASEQDAAARTRR